MGAINWPDERLIACAFVACKFVACKFVAVMFVVVNEETWI